MKREIKFRAWNTHTKTMIDLKKITPLALDPAMGECDGLFLPFQNVLELMQFTGLKDKNGKEVYEGDIIQCWYGGDKHGAVEKVEFKDGAFILRHRTTPISFYLEYDGTYTTDIEVIGNIYENPTS